MQQLSLQGQAQTNQVLMKTQVGAVKQTTYDLPAPCHFYGKALFRDRTGAKEASSNWKYPSLSRQKIPKQDFMAVNRNAMQSGVHDLTAINSFRDSHVYAQKVNRGGQSVDMVIPSHSFQYGKRNRPNTPIQFVVGNFYGIQDEIHNNQSKQERIDRSHYQNQKTSSSLQPIKDTRASTFYKQHNRNVMDKMNMTNQKPLFKMRKFGSIGSRTDTGVLKLSTTHAGTFVPEDLRASINQKNRNIKSHPWKQ